MWQCLSLVGVMLVTGCPQPNTDTSSSTSSSSSSSSSGGAVSSSSAAASSSGAAQSSSLAPPSSAATSAATSTASSALPSSSNTVPSSSAGFPNCGASPCPWPAETLASATNLTAVEGPTPNDFGQDLSGAHWNADSQTLWLTRNGGTGGSKVWAVESDGAGGWQVATRGGQRAEWTGFGDAEGITQAPGLTADHVLVLVEGADEVRHYDLSVGGTATLVHTWTFASLVPAYNGDLGSEAITFVPNNALTRTGFVNGQGQPDTATGGLGGLVLVGHQAGGHVYALDLELAPAVGVRLVGDFQTGFAETAALEWDAASDRLLIWHGDGRNDLEVARLASTLQGNTRALDSEVTYDLPGGANHEGLAVMDASFCVSGNRGLWLTTDDGGNNALYLFASFPCP